MFSVNDVVGQLVILGVFKVPTKKSTLLDPKYKTVYGCMCLNCEDTKVITNPKNGFYCSCKRQAKKKSYKKTKDKLFMVWHNMRNRCFNSNNKSFKHYGLRGIGLYPKWLFFHNFKEWALKNGYKEGLTIDRIDVNSDYEPDNCRWVDYITQANNRTNNHHITWNGKTQTIAEWEREFGWCYNSLRSRITTLKWSIEKAMTTPIKQRKPRNRP